MIGGDSHVTRTEGWTPSCDGARIVHSRAISRPPSFQVLSGDAPGAVAAGGGGGDGARDGGDGGNGASGAHSEGGDTSHSWLSGQAGAAGQSLDALNTAAFSALISGFSSLIGGVFGETDSAPAPLDLHGGGAAASAAAEAAAEASGAENRGLGEILRAFRFASAQVCADSVCVSVHGSKQLLIDVLERLGKPTDGDTITKEEVAAARAIANKEPAPLPEPRTRSNRGMVHESSSSGGLGLGVLGLAPLGGGEPPLPVAAVSSTARFGLHRDGTRRALRGSWSAQGGSSGAASATAMLFSLVLRNSVTTVRVSLPIARMKLLATSHTQSIELIDDPSETRVFALTKPSLELVHAAPDEPSVTTQVFRRPIDAPRAARALGRSLRTHLTAAVTRSRAPLGGSHRGETCPTSWLALERLLSSRDPFLSPSPLRPVLRSRGLRWRAVGTVAWQVRRFARARVVLARALARRVRVAHAHGRRADAACRSARRERRVRARVVRGVLAGRPAAGLPRPLCRRGER